MPDGRWQVRCCSDKSNVTTNKSRHIPNLMLRMKLGRRPSFKMTSPMLGWQVQCPNIQVQKQEWFGIKNEAGPKAQLQNDKSNAALKSPMSQHASPDTFLIWCWAQLQNGKSNPGVTSPLSQHASQALKWQVQCWADKSNVPTCKSGNNYNVVLRIKLGRRLSFIMTSPTLRWQVQRPDMQLRKQS